MKWNHERKDFVLSVLTVTLVFILCKVFGIFTLSWFWILSPLWLSAIAVIVLKVWFEIFIKSF